MNSTPHDVCTLLAEQGAQLHALLFRLTLRNDVADDLLQELFCRLAKSVSFQQADNPEAFAYRTATNLAFDWRRSKKREPTVDANNGELVAPIISPLADLVRREELEQTLTAIGELPTINRDIIVLRYLQDQSYESIAEQFGKTTHQVRAIVHKAIKQLRKLVEEAPKQAAEPQRTEGK